MAARRAARSSANRLFFFGSYEGYVYQLPWQTGRGPGGFFRTLINDWQVNGIWQMYSGSRFSVGVSLGGNRRLEIRFEASNVRNRPKRANPDDNASLDFDTFNADRTAVDPDFMVINETVGDMRQARVALRFSD